MAEVTPRWSLLTKSDEWINRTVVYTCRQVADQAHDEFDYSKLEPVIQISIMDYTLFADHKRFFKAYRVADDEGYVYTDKIQFWVMDLTQVNEATEEQKAQGLVEWAKAFRADSWEEVNQIQNSAVKEAAKTMKLMLSPPLLLRTQAFRFQRLLNCKTRFSLPSNPHPTSGAAVRRAFSFYGGCDDLLPRSGRVADRDT